MDNQNVFNFRLFRQNLPCINVADKPKSSHYYAPDFVNALSSLDFALIRNYQAIIDLLLDYLRA